MGSSVFPCSVDLTAPDISLSSLGGSDQIISSIVGDSTVTGQAEPEQPLTLSVLGSGGTRQLGVITPDRNGAFTFIFGVDDLAALGQGSDFTLSLRQSDIAGNVRTFASDFIIDTIAPSAPLITAFGGADGTISGAQLDNTIRGLAEANAPVSLMLIEGSGLTSLLGSTVANESGNFVFSLSPAQLSKLPQGSGLQVVANTSDQAGNTTSSKPFNAAIDTISPDLPVITAIGGTDAVLTSVSGDQSIRGTATPYSSVLLQTEIDGNTVNLGSTLVNGQGLFSYVLSSSNLTSLGQGLRRFWAVISDLAGNQSKSVTASATVDTIPESFPVITSVGGSDRIVSSLSTDQKITGKASIGRPVTLNAILPASGRNAAFSLDLGIFMPDSEGNFVASLTSRNLQDLGQNPSILLYASQPDTLGNIGISEPYAFSVDTELPEVAVIKSVGGADSVITGLTDALIVGKSTPGAEVTLLAKDSILNYHFISKVIANISGEFSYSLTQSQIDGLNQGPGCQIMAQVSDYAGNTASSSPFEFSLVTLPPAPPIFSGLVVTGSQAYLKMDAIAYQNGFTVAGTAPGASSVELRIGSKTIPTRAYVNNEGSWSIQLSPDQLPFSKVTSTTTIQAIAMNPYGAVSDISQTSLVFDTANPTILTIANEGDKVRVVFDELVSIPTSPTDSKIGLRSGSRTIGIKSLQGVTNSLGNTELVLELNETLPTNTVVRLSYFGSRITDEFGNKLSQFNNRIVTDLALNLSINSPGYAYANLMLTGNENLFTIGNLYANTIYGNSGDNMIEGAGGADILTGGPGRDTFVFSSYRDSILIDPVTGNSSVDKITDFAIGTDIIDGPSFVENISLLRIESPQFGPISPDLLQSLLPLGGLAPEQAAILTFTSSEMTFLVLNDNKAGYSPSEDILIDITGYSGLVGNLNIL